MMPLKIWYGVPRTLPAALFTARATPKHRSVQPPAELALIRWQR